MAHDMVYVALLMSAMKQMCPRSLSVDHHIFAPVSFTEFFSTVFLYTIDRHKGFLMIVFIFRIYF